MTCCAGSLQHRSNLQVIRGTPPTRQLKLNIRSCTQKIWKRKECESIICSRCATGIFCPSAGGRNENRLALTRNPRWRQGTVKNNYFRRFSSSPCPRGRPSLLAVAKISNLNPHHLCAGVKRVFPVRYTTATAVRTPTLLLLFMTLVTLIDRGAHLRWTRVLLLPRLPLLLLLLLRMLLYDGASSKKKRSHI